MTGRAGDVASEGWVVIDKRGQSWCVYLDGQFISDHATRDGAVAAARNIMRAEAERG